MCGVILSASVNLPRLGGQQTVFQDNILKKSKEFIRCFSSVGRCLANSCEAGLQCAQQLLWEGKCCN